MQLHELKIGGYDQRGRKILDILWSTKDYVIFRHASGLSPHFSDDDSVAQRQRLAYAAIGPQLSKVNALRSTTVWRAESIDREIARSIYQSLEGDIESAKRILDGVGTRLQNLINIQGRLQYQISCLLTALMFAFVYLAIYYCFDEKTLDHLSLVRFASVAFWGALGGFLSISIGLNKVTIDADADRRINAIAGSSRIVIAVVGSIFVYLTIVSELALTSLNLLKSDAAIYAISMAAGFSEKLVPDILRGLSIDGSEKNDRKPTQSGD